MNAVQAHQHSIEEWVAMAQAIENDPANASKDGLYLYSKPARRKLATISAAIAFQLAEKRAEAGNPVTVAGYSGRQTNRR